ncbi:SagB/ThcOx family dehydrogenase [Azospirillum sp. TSH100]|uniref:SagB/ThcOx family dehydrogenase n=1 Tax=Azospirillum sp. TSH100 TaxID=652764 RepID=UPI000D646CFF|nr:SagB/ThcOx family dehydrogenase [Azospirillum sp. TSH100]
MVYLDKSAASPVPTFAQSRTDNALVEDFHAATKFTRYDLPAQVLHSFRYMSGTVEVKSQALNYKCYLDYPTVPLPVPDSVEMHLDQALNERRSQRQYAGTPLPLRQLSTVLVRSLARERITSVGHVPGVELSLASFPSGGGLFPTEAYVVPFACEGLVDGIAHFDARGRSLELIRSSVGAAERASALGLPPALRDGIGAAILLTATFQRSTVKYGGRGYRFALLEAGHAAQNLLLVAAALGLGTLAWGGYLDDEVATLLGINGVEEAPVHCILLGVPSEQDAP